MKDKIQEAYADSKNIYDDVLFQKKLWSRLYIRFFWGGTDDVKIAQAVLNYIPDDFSGNVLDVPVGTASFTKDKWIKLKKAKIICLDYSEEMLNQARYRLKGQSHIQCIQGDVSALPIEDTTIDIVVTMNGMHVFPNKKKAWDEIDRVLHPGGSLVACFYIKNKSKRTDWLVNHILSKKGWFSPPFYSEEELRRLLEQKYEIQDFHVDGSMVYFHGIKKQCR